MNDECKVCGDLSCDKPEPTQQEGQERYKIEPWREGGNVVRDYEDSKCVIGGFGIPHHQAELICKALNQFPKPDSATDITISRKCAGDAQADIEYIYRSDPAFKDFDVKDNENWKELEAALKK